MLCRFPRAFARIGPLPVRGSRLAAVGRRDRIVPAGLRPYDPLASVPRLMDSDKLDRLARTQETILRLIRDGDTDAALTILDGLGDDERRMMFVSVVKKVNVLRQERGDDPDDTFGPTETVGLEPSR